jgi:hypothetical protein
MTNNSVGLANVLSSLGNKHFKDQSSQRITRLGNIHLCMTNPVVVVLYVNVFVGWIGCAL